MAIRLRGLTDEERAEVERLAASRIALDLAGGRDFPKIQILAVADILAGREKARYPSQDKGSLLGYRAALQEKAAPHPQLFGDD